MFKSRRFVALFGVTLISALGGIYLKSDNQVENFSDAQDETVLASVWDKPSESYSGNKEITVYRSPSCGCCGVWIEHMKKHGFQVTDIKTDNLEAIKQKYNLPISLESCHTATIDGYVIEGHIPAHDIKRFLKQKHKFAGLAVPGMPLGTPGMEAGQRKQPFEVLAFNQSGEVEVFKNYSRY